MYGTPHAPTGFGSPQNIAGFPNPAGADFASAKPPLPPIGAGWVVASIIFFWPVAFAAANWSSKVYPLWAQGDYNGAQHASDRAKKLGKIALIVCAISTVLFIVFYALIIAAAISSAADASSYSY